jgi:hypothetical protein
MGISLDDKGELIITELERRPHPRRIGQVRQSGYPGYLGRLRKDHDRIFLACLARRDPLIEFLKTEQDFVAEMTAKIAPQHRIAPRVSPGVQP